jgi:integrase
MRATVVAGRTRSELSWLPSPTGGWFDLEGEILYRRGMRARRARNKNQPPARIHEKLQPHLRRWKEADLAHGIIRVVHYRGQPVKKLRRSWNSVARTAGAERPAAPHICRHTAATWQMQAGTDLFEAAGYLGMSPETLWREYGHHHPSFQQRAARAVPRQRAFQDTSRKPPEPKSNSSGRD